MTMNEFWDLQHRIDRVRDYVNRGLYSSGSERLRELCHHAHWLLDEVARELTRVEIRRIYEPWELWDLEALAYRLRDCGRRAAKFTKCGDSRELLNWYCRSVDELQGAIENAWCRVRTAA